MGAPGSRIARRPKITDVANAAGVSITTVSHSLSGRGFVDPATRQRVQAVARKLGYRPNVHAQRLRTGGAHTIVLLSSMPFAVAAGPSRLGFMMEIAAVAASAALTRGLALVLAAPLETAETPLDALDIDGALVIEPAAVDRNVAYLEQRGLPLVTIGKQPGSVHAIPYVDIHSAATTRALLGHLYGEGARRIALIVGAERRNSYVESESVYQSFAQEHAMPAVISRADESDGEEAGRVESLRLLVMHPELDALCVPIDAFAVGAARAMREAGRDVPSDVKIVTRYDGLRARHCTPPLTAMNLHLDQVASLAVDLLFEHLHGNTRRLAIAGPEPDLIVRESSRRG